MSVTTDIFITPSTSLVLVKNLSTVTNVYLPSFTPTTPLFSVTIRDTTGLSNIATNPVRISTISNATFLDGTHYTEINTPYGLVNVSLRNSNTWQINHTSGKPPSQAAANIGILSTNSSFFTVLSTSAKYISTLIVENLTTPNPVLITNPILITNLAAPGFVLFDQTFYVRDQVTISSLLNVSSATRIFSSLFTTDLEPVKYNAFVYSSIGVAGSVFLSTLTVKSTVTLYSTVQVSTVQVTLSTPTNTVFISQSLQAAGLLSTLGNLAVFRRTTVQGNVELRQEVSSLGFFSTTNLIVKEDTNVLGNISSLGIGVPSVFLSSVNIFSTLETKQTISLASSIGVQATWYTSSFSTFQFVANGSISTSQLTLLSSASFSGTISTAFLQTFQTFEIGGNLFLPQTLSSVGLTRVAEDISVNGNALVQSAHTSSSVGVGGDIIVKGSTIVPSVTVQGDFFSKNTIVNGYSKIEGDVVARSNSFVYGNMFVSGEPTISSFLVESFLLSNLQILTSTPFTSFQASSLYVSSLLTDFTRIAAPLPDILQVSSLYTSSTQLTNTLVETAVFQNSFANSLTIGSLDTLSKASDPRFAVNVKTQFADGLSSLEIRADTLEASGRVQANLVGTVSYLSNVTAPFAFFSGITTTLSTATLSNLFTSSFEVSTFAVNKLIHVFSTVITPYLAIESQGFPTRYDVNQILSVDSNTLAINRNLRFDIANNRVGLFQSTPEYELDISGLVYATNFLYSSINAITISTPGTTVYSTITVSSSFIRDNLSYGANGVRILSTDPLFGNTSFTIQTTSVAPQTNFGFYDFNEQSSILINTGVVIGSNRCVGINTLNAFQGTIIPPFYPLTVFDTLRAEEAYVSTINIGQTLQAKSFVTPTFSLNSNPLTPLNTISSSSDRLFLNNIFTIKSDPLTVQRYVGIHTMDPSANLDVRGNAYVSTLVVGENFRVNFVAIGSQDL